MTFSKQSIHAARIIRDIEMTIDALESLGLAVSDGKSESGREHIGSNLYDAASEAANIIIQDMIDHADRSDPETCNAIVIARLDAIAHCIKPDHADSLIQSILNELLVSID